MSRVVSIAANGRPRKEGLGILNNWAAGRRDNRAFNDHGNPGPNAANVGYLQTIRGRVHDAVRNTPLAARAVEILITNIVGSGIIPRAADENVRALIRDWVHECDADGINDLFGIQEGAVGGFAESGEAFIRLRPRRLSDGLSIPLQVQLLEAEMLPLHDEILNNGNTIKQGIEFNSIGKRVAYWFHKDHPGDTYSGAASIHQLTRVPAEFVCHIFEPRRPGQIRGFPRLATSLQRAQQMNDWDEATIERQKQSSNITMVIRRPVPDTPGTDPITGEEVNDEREVSEMAAGSAYLMLPGEEIDSPDLPSVGREYDAFTTWQGRMIASGAGVPYEILANDFSKMNDRTARIMLNEFRRRVGQHQDRRVIFQMMRPIWIAALEAAVLAGSLKADVDRSVRWVKPAWAYINPVQDVETQERQVKAGFRSKTDVVYSLGTDPQDVLAENIQDTAEAKKHGLSFSTGLAVETEQAAKAQANAEARAESLHGAEMRVREALAAEHGAGELLAKAKAWRERSEADERKALGALARAKAAHENMQAECLSAGSKARIECEGKELDARLQALQEQRDQAVAESEARIKAAAQAATDAAEYTAINRDQEREIQAERLAVAKLEREAAEAGLAELRGA